MTRHKISANVTELRLSNGTRIMVPYSTPVAAWIPGTGYVRTSTWYSRTTSRHITTWLYGCKAAAALVPQCDIDALIP